MPFNLPSISMDTLLQSLLYSEQHTVIGSLSCPWENGELSSDQEELILDISGNLSYQRYLKPLVNRSLLKRRGLTKILFFRLIDCVAEFQLI